jgi:membrane protein implicated in regulation of membrane protease activity
MMDCDFRKAIMDINRGVGDFRYRNGSWRARCARCAHYMQASVEICRVIRHVTCNYIVMS